MNQHKRNEIHHIVKSDSVHNIAQSPRNQHGHQYMDHAKPLLPGYPEQEEQDNGQHQETCYQNKGFPILKQTERNPCVLEILQLQHAVNQYQWRLVLQMKRYQIFCKLIQRQQ